MKLICGSFKYIAPIISILCPLVYDDRNFRKFFLKVIEEIPIHDVIFKFNLQYCIEIELEL